MFTQPYSIYIDKRPMRIVFLVDSGTADLEDVDQIIDYNRSLWGGRFNPIILTDGHTIEDKWWKFLREIDPDVIRTLVPLDIELIEKFENFLSPLIIEQASVGTRSSVYEKPAGIDINTLNFFELGVSYGEPTLGVFDLDEIDDEIAKLFVLRNFGPYQSAIMRYHISATAFHIPISLENTLQQGEIPPEVHEGFKKSGIPLSGEVFSKQSVQGSGNWAIIDKENNQIHYIERVNNKLSVLPQRPGFSSPSDEIKKQVFVVTDRRSLADTLLKVAHAQNIVFHNQICALPNTEREIEEDTTSACFDVIVGDTSQDIVHFWNRPLSLPRWKRGRMNPIWLPKTLATDPDMEDALCTWINRVRWNGGTLETVRFVSFSIEEQELEEIASRFRKNPRAYGHTVKTYFEETQIPNFFPEDPLSFQQEDPFSFRANSIDIHRVQGNEGILKLTEPKELAQGTVSGHWMADFHVEFTHDRYGNHEDVIRRLDRNSLFWRFPNRNHLMHQMFDKPSRVKRNGFPSVMMPIGETVLRFSLEDAESVVASLFWRENRPADEHSDPRTQLVAAPYYLAEPSDKGKYLQGVLELFGNLTFAYTVLSNPYWRKMFDALSKDTRAEQHAHEFIANKLRKEIGRSGSLTVTSQVTIESIAKLAVNEAKKLDLKQKELPFDRFMQEAEQWRKEYIKNVKVADDQSEEDILGFRREDVEVALTQLTQRNIIQIGIKPHCPRCGLAQWYYVDDISQHLTCQGCRIQFPLHPEPTWHYRLNELTRVAYALHGTTPVILVLGQLFRRCRTSFFFSPNLNLLTKPQDASPEKLDKVAEVDIACVQDGKFIIGEVKQSMSLFKKKDFDTMAEIAEQTKPNIVLFSCVDSQKPTKSIASHIERIRIKLSPLDIDVKWYELEFLDYMVSV